jgi:hypothetical protein
MMRVIPISAGVVLAALLAAFLPIEATHGQSMHMRQHAPAARSAKAYAPGLGEVMSLQQMRHSKLWFAGSAANWELARYELDELGEGFDDVAKLFPTHDGMPLGPMVKTITGREIPDLAKAIEARDGAKFASAFDALTAACNACHQSVKHGFIVIQRPASLPYSNQSFAPASH